MVVRPLLYFRQTQKLSTFPTLALLALAPTPLSNARPVLVLACLFAHTPALISVSKELLLLSFSKTTNNVCATLISLSLMNYNITLRYKCSPASRFLCGQLVATGHHAAVLCDIETLEVTFDCLLSCYACSYSAHSSLNFRSLTAICALIRLLLYRRPYPWLPSCTSMSRKSVF